MLVVLVKHVNGAGLNGVHLAVGHCFHLTSATNAVHRLQMVLVVQVQFSATINGGNVEREAHVVIFQQQTGAVPSLDRKSTRLNSSHVDISYAVCCLKKKIHAK